MMVGTAGIHRAGAIMGTFQSNQQSLDPYIGTCSNSIPFGNTFATPLSFNEFVAHVVGRSIAQLQETPCVASVW
jgi:hypothetical protein